MYDVQVVVQGVQAADEDHLEALTTELEKLGALDPAAVFYPGDEEIGIVFQMREEDLGRLLEPERDRRAA